MNPKYSNYVDQHAIYIVSYPIEGLTNFFKVGSTMNIHNRIPAYRTSNPFLYEILAVYFVDKNSYDVDDAIQIYIETNATDKLYRTFPKITKEYLERGGKKAGGLEWYVCKDGLNKLKEVIEHLFFLKNIKFKSIKPNEVEDAIKYFKKERFTKSKKEQRKIRAEIIMDLEDEAERIDNRKDKLKLKMKKLQEKIIKKQNQEEKVQEEYKPRFHQYMIIETIMKNIKKGSNQFIVAACPRSGKSYIMSFLCKRFDELKFKNILITTTFPSETIGGYEKALKILNTKYGYNMINYKDSSSVKSMKESIDFNQKNIVIISKQSLIRKGSEIKQFINKFNCLFTDEFHYGGASALAINKLNDFKGLKIHLTGTFYKVSARYDIDNSNILLWDYADIKYCKNITNINDLTSKYPKKLVLSYIKQNKITDIFNIREDYLKFPNQKYLSLNKDVDITPAELFLMSKNKKDEFSSFKNNKQLNQLLGKIFKDTDNGLFRTIKKRDGDTLNKKTGIILYLPQTQSTAKTMKLLSTKIKKEFPDRFEIESLNSENNKKDKLMKKYKVKTLEEALIRRFEDCKEEKHLIFIVRNMLEVGISLPFVDIVIKLHNSESYEKNVQQNFRSCTERNGKKEAYIIDYNYQNVFNTILFNFNPKNTKSKKDIIKLIFDYELLIDCDINYHEMDNALEIIAKLDFTYNIEKSELNINMDKMKNYNGNWKIKKTKFNKKKEVLKTEKEVKAGVATVMEKVARGQSDKKKTNKKSKKISQEEEDLIKLRRYKKFFKNLIDVIIFHNQHLFKKGDSLNSLFKKGLKNEKFISFVREHIEKNYEIDLNNNFKNILINIYKDMVILVNDFDSINNIYIKNFMNNIDKLNDKKIEQKFLFVHSLMNPTDSTRKTAGEVLTPFTLIDEMLDKLPKKVWSDPNLKWADIASGLGNYQLKIYQRLMKGLSKKISNKDKRKKHILEKMIYYAELGSNNTELYKKIIDPKNKYKLNVFQGNSLENSLSKYMKNVWKIKSFDIIVGNPPYQGTGRKKIYINFINTAFSLLKQDGILLYITPILAVNYLMGSEIVQQIADNLKDIKYINVNANIKKKFTGVGSDFAYYLVYNREYTNKTIIEFSDGHRENIKLKWKTIIPLDVNKNYYNITKKVLNINKNEWERKAARFSDNLSDEKTETHKYKIVQKIKTNEIVYKWSNRTHKTYTFHHKVFFPTLGNNYLIDKEANQFPGTSFVIFIPTNSLEESKNIVKLKKSKLFKFLEKVFDNLRSPSDYIWKNLKKIDITNNMTNKDIYQKYNLTSSDIKIIESL